LRSQMFTITQSFRRQQHVTLWRAATRLPRTFSWAFASLRMPQGNKGAKWARIHTPGKRDIM
jgi:hypothetical protein